MTTPNDDVPDAPAGVDEIASPDTAPKLRRFAPRRSRSTAAPTTAAEDTIRVPVATGGNASTLAEIPAAVSILDVEALQLQGLDAPSTEANATAATRSKVPGTFDVAISIAPESGAELSAPANLATGQSAAASELGVDPPTDSPSQAPARPSRRARSRRTPRPAADRATADGATPAVSGQDGDDLAAGVALQVPTLPVHGTVAETTSADQATDMATAKPKRNRSRNRSRAKDVTPAPSAPIVAPPAPPRSHRRRTKEATPTAGELLPPVASEIPPADEAAPAKPARPRRSRSRRPAAASSALEPEALSMLGTVPAAALVGLDAPAIALPADSETAPLRQPDQLAETDLLGTVAPTLDAAGPPVGAAARVVLPTAIVPDEAVAGIVPVYEGPQPAALAPDALGTDTVSADAAGSRASLAALAPDVLGTDTVSLSQTAPPVTPALDREGMGGNGLFSAAEAALAADRYEAAARRGQVGSGSGDAILAQALRELFPLLPDLSDDTPTVEEEAPAATQVEDDLQGEEPSELEADAADDGGLDDDEQDDLQGSDLQDGDANRRRGRRGRRGGRGRRRNGAGASILDADGREAQDDDDEVPAAAAPSIAASSPSTSGVPAPASESDAFTPQQPPRPERSWREGGPRRPWGRTYRDSASPSMPAPKPANGIRPGPIPQAAPPETAIVAQPEVVTQAVPAFAMPNLRLNEPLNPGETRTERLLEAQTILLRTMLQQQARQIDVLTTAVDGLRQSVQGLAGGGARGYMPRTAIFVDAPNVVYAAENARVQLDYGRMLKYFSKDRHLVHALSYSPIIDDVREGIRYETQRFVAPFLRTGWKLITKPLKRFSDGSAKGNFDIELAVDIVTMSERLDIVVLVSGDSDFERLIQLIQSRGVRVEVVAFASNVSTELVNIADVFIDIGQHLEHLRAL